VIGDGVTMRPVRWPEIGIPVTTGAAETPDDTPRITVNESSAAGVSVLGTVQAVEVKSPWAPFCPYVQRAGGLPGITDRLPSAPAMSAVGEVIKPPIAPAGFVNGFKG
jgi:hypothetical protein